MPGAPTQFDENDPKFANELALRACGNHGEHRVEVPRTLENLAEKPGNCIVFGEGFYNTYEVCAQCDKWDKASRDRPVKVCKLCGPWCYECDDKDANGSLDDKDVWNFTHLICHPCVADISDNVGKEAELPFPNGLVDITVSYLNVFDLLTIVGK